MTWCSLTNRPMRASGSPGRNHISHSGRDRSRRRRRSCSVASSSCASSPGAGSATTRTWSLRSNAGASAHSGPAQASPRHVEELPEPGQKVQPTLPGPVTNLFVRALMGAGADVTVRRGHLRGPVDLAGRADPAADRRGVTPVRGARCCPAAWALKAVTTWRMSRCSPSAAHAGARPGCKLTVSRLELAMTRHHWFQPGSSQTVTSG